MSDVARRAAACMQALGQPVWVRREQRLAVETGPVQTAAAPLMALTATLAPGRSATDLRALCVNIARALDVTLKVEDGAENMVELGGLELPLADLSATGKRRLWQSLREIVSDGAAA